MLALTLLALSSMMTSVIIGRTIEGEATAVNIAGSLRMQSYLIATKLLSANELDERTHWQRMQGLLQTFEGRLYGKELSNILPHDENHEVRRSFDRVKTQWEQEIRPVLDAYVSGIIPSHTRPNLAPRTWGMISDASVISLRERYLSRVERFVENIDVFVKALSTDAEAKINRLQSFQGGALFLTFAIVLFALLFSRHRVVMPLRRLLTSAEAAGRGDFSQRTGFTGADELGRLGLAFNDMSERLSKLYGDLEARVRRKTVHLERSNRSLDVLYKTVKRLSSTPFPHVTYQGLLEEVTKLAGTGPAVICLTGDVKDKAHQLASTRGCDNRQETCEKGDCGKCLGRGELHFFDQSTASGKRRKVMSLPIRDAHAHHGVLLVEARDEKGFEDWQKKVLQAVASHIGLAITMSGLHAEQNRFALLAERSAIARELHDSLAQSLSYAKIQVSRLQRELGEGDENRPAQKINAELRDGLNRAYRELRELLTTFRLTMEDEDLIRTIRATTEEFAERGQMDISFVGDCPNGLLSPNEEIHILQIVREALSNVLRHSGAKKAEVRLTLMQNGAISLSIEDDGKGMEHKKNGGQRQHYGLLIMRERAASLGGELQMGTGAMGRGTRIELSIQPVAMVDRSTGHEAETSPPERFSPPEREVHVS